MTWLYLYEAIVSECNVHADHGDESLVAFLLVVVNSLTVFENLGNSLDQGDELNELASKEFRIGDLENKVRLRFLWQATPATSKVNEDFS